MSIIQGLSKVSAASTFSIDNSCILNASNNTYLMRIPSTGGSNSVFTFSAWIKRANLGYHCFFSAEDSPQGQFAFNSSNQLCMWDGATEVFKTTRKFRDPHGWLHVIIAVDSGESGTDKVKVWINGVLEDDFATDNRSSFSDLNNVNQSSQEQRIGQGGDSAYTDGYLADVVMLDGTQAVNTDLGEFDDNGVWRPIDISEASLTFGNNGFFLPFTTTDSLGEDFSGNTAQSLINQNTESGVNEINKGDMTSAGVTLATKFVALSSSAVPVVKVHATSLGFSSATIRIETDSGGSAPSGTLVDSDGELTGFTSSGSGWKTITFPNGGPELTAGTSYWLVLANTGNWGVSHDYASAGGTDQTMGLLNMRSGLGYTTSQSFGHEIYQVGNSWEEKNSPTQTSDSPTDNYCTLTPLWLDGHTLSDGNLVASAAGDSAAIGTMAFDATDSSGFYFEAKVTTAATYPNVGIRTVESPSQVGAVTSLSGNSTERYSFTGSDGTFNDAGSSGSYGSAWSGAADKVIGVYIKAGALYFSIDGTIQNSGTAAKTGLTGYMLPTVFYDAGSGTTASWELRFNESDWSTTPSGYKAISTNNLSASAIADSSAYFQTRQYSGNAGTQEVNQDGNSSFAPSLLWIKRQGDSGGNTIFDSVRTTDDPSSAGTGGEFLRTDNTDEEKGEPAWKTMDDNGWTMDGGGTEIDINSSSTFVGHMWKESATAGFDIVSDEGDGSTHTISHSLGVTPEFIIRKKRDSGTDDNWIIWHKSLSGTNYYIYLNSYGGQDTSVNYWADTSPTSSVFSVGASNGTNEDGKAFITYLFTSIEGFSKFGSYAGSSNEDGVFIPMSFSPAFFMVKYLSGNTDWMIWDVARNPGNPLTSVLAANGSGAETDRDESHTNEMTIDFISNGVKMRNDHGDINGSGSWLYAAWAKHPFIGTSPVTAK